MMIKVHGFGWFYSEKQTGGRAGARREEDDGSSGLNPSVVLETYADGGGLDTLRGGTAGMWARRC